MLSNCAPEQLVKLVQHIVLTVKGVFTSLKDTTKEEDLLVFLLWWLEHLHVYRHVKDHAVS